MVLQIYKYLLLSLLCQFSFALNQANATTLASQTTNYLYARVAIENNDYAKYNRLMTKLGDYVLKPIAESDYVYKELPRLQSSYLKNYLDNNSDIYVSNRIRKKWLHLLIKERDWNTFKQVYNQDVNDVELKCYYINQLITTRKINKEIDDKIHKIWHSANSRPDSCTPLFNKWHNKGYLTRDRVFARIGLAIRRKNNKLALFLGKEYLSSQDLYWVLKWINVYKDPGKHLTTIYYTGKNQVELDIIMQGLDRVSAQYPEFAESYWRNLVRKSPSLRKFEEQAYANMGYRSAKNHYINSSELMLKASFEDKKVRQWAMRSAIREHNWKRVLYFYKRLKKGEKKQLKWRYWRARALEKTGKKRKAKNLYAKISKQRDYYSFLAADKLNRNYHMNDIPIKLSTNSLKKQRRFRIAHELYQIEGANIMRKQWYWATRSLKHKELLAAAKLASQWGFHDQAIFTAGRAKYYDDITLRFPLLYKDQILRKASLRHLPPSYIYGVMRQESAFRDQVKSPAGALGLMQIMPATGRIIWKKQQKSNYNSNQLLNADINIDAGTYYLDHLLNQFDDNFPMATAAYNAGPSRARKWRADYGLDADIWIETIPFNETRRYVQNVLLYKTIYEHLLGIKMTRLTHLLARVSAKS